MLKVSTEEQKKAILAMFDPEVVRYFPLNFDRETDWGFEECDDRIYLDGNITFDKMAEIVDYIRACDSAKK